jgi:hypothetical protein
MINGGAGPTRGGRPGHCRPRRRHRRLPHAVNASRRGSTRRRQERTEVSLRLRRFLRTVLLLLLRRAGIGRSGARLTAAKRPRGMALDGQRSNTEMPRHRSVECSGVTTCHTCVIAGFRVLEPARRCICNFLNDRGNSVGRAPDTSPPADLIEQPSSRKAE